MVRLGTCFPVQSWDSDASWSLAVIGGGSRSSGDGRDGRAGPLKDGTGVVGTAALAVIIPSTPVVSIAVAPRCRGASSSILFLLLISTRAAGGLFSSLCR